MNPYHEIAAKIADLVTNKQIQYGDAHGKSGDILRIIYEDGINPKQMDDALTVVRIIDKLFRIANHKTRLLCVDTESPWEDIMGYALLQLNKEKNAKS